MSFRLLLTLKSRSIVRLFSIPPHGKVVVGGCDDGCYIWKLYDGSSDKSDKNSKIRLAYISDDLKWDIRCHIWC